MCKPYFFLKRWQILLRQDELLPTTKFLFILFAASIFQPAASVLARSSHIHVKEPSSFSLNKRASKYDITVNGTVRDTKGEPMPGVSIKVQGTTTGTMTNSEGRFSLKVPDQGGVLLISFIGYKSQTVQARAGAALNIVLKEQANELAGVVVTALGLKRSEKSLSYATQQVSSAQLNTVKTDNLMNSLNGKVAGVTITPSASGVGGSTKVLLRGSRSINGNNQPLYVIDGVPISNTSNANGQAARSSSGAANTLSSGGQPNGNFGGTPEGGDGISNLNPEDIASISVLEGASAAALYGSQAQNGVILITTKKGKAGKTSVEFSSSARIDLLAYKPKFQNDFGKSSDVLSWGPRISKGTQDNLKEFYQDGTNFTNSINLSGGSDLMQTYFSYANTTARGLIPGNKLVRNNFNLRETGHFLNNKLTVDANITYVDQKTYNSPSLGLYTNPLVGLYLFPRGEDILPYKRQYLFPDKKGIARQNWISTNDDSQQQNPWFTTNLDPNNLHRNRIIFNGSAKYDVAAWLNVQARGSVDRIVDTYESDLYSGTSAAVNSNTQGRLTLSNQTNTQQYADVIANLTAPDMGKFKLNGVLGASVLDQKNETRITLGDLSTPDFFTPGNTIVTRGGGLALSNDNRTQTHLLLPAVFANANLSYKDWAFLTLTARNDWSSHLSFTNNNSYFYPSAGLSLVLSQMFSLPKAISFAKLRGTYAEVGNTIPNPYLTTTQNYQNSAGQLVFNTAAPFRTLKPERTKSIEVGADMRFIDNLINFTFTYYKTNTRDQFVPLKPSPTTLIALAYVNAGNIQNQGIEFTLGADVLRNQAFTWNTSFAGSLNRNKIIDLDSKDGISQFILTGSEGGGFAYQSILTKGGSYGDIYGNAIVRNDKGQIVLTGDGTANMPYKPQSMANSYLGNASPRFQLGWSNTLGYKNFNLSFLVDGKFGGKVLSLTEAMLDSYGVSKNSGDARLRGEVTINGVDAKGNAVTKVDPQAWYTSIGGRNGISSEYMYSATVVRLREASLGYKWALSNKNFVKSVKLSLIGRNLFYFYKKAPFDPEITASTGNGLAGVDLFNQPATSSMGLNLNVIF